MLPDRYRTHPLDHSQCWLGHISEIKKIFYCFIVFLGHFVHMLFKLGVGANMRTVRDLPNHLGQCPIFHRFLVLKASRIREYYKNKYCLVLVAFSQLIFEHNSLGQVPRLFNQSWLGNLLFNFQTRAWDWFLFTNNS